MEPDFLSLPPDLPVPEDDGAAAHLVGRRLPNVSLEATDGGRVTLSALAGRSVVYAYPRTGEPGRPNLVPDWDLIPGARGCTPQTCSFRDHHAALRALGVAHLHGLSTQTSAYQREAAERLHLPFTLLADPHLAFTKALGLPTFVAAGQTLLRRLTMIVDEGVVTKVFYPVFPPDRSADDVLAWLRAPDA
ncbi:peroxiredoxin [Methylobacterium segetis]|uniref:peroxiredoxin n=1 Tax=Methylobacterium segetis TaxID=2488750 RepID=UPI0010531A73|nr:peroxiredoxin [Methylobacterium segetis]